MLPIALAFCRRKLEELQLKPEPRKASGEILLTDNGNHILDCHVDTMSDPMTLEHSLRAIPGVVGTGLFLAMAHVALVQEGDAVQIMRRPSAGPTPPR